MLSWVFYLKLAIIFQDFKAKYYLAWEHSLFFFFAPFVFLQTDIWGTTAEIPYLMTSYYTQIWVGDASSATSNIILQGNHMVVSRRVGCKPTSPAISFQGGKCKQQFENYQASAILILNNSRVIHVQFAGPVTGAHEGVIEG